MKNSRNVYEEVTQKIIAHLEKGNVPWCRPFHSDAINQFPTNMSTGQRYSGINIVLLLAEEYYYPYWATFNQIKKMNGKVKKGSSATEIVYTNYIIRHKDTGEKISIQDFRALDKETRKLYRVSKFLKFHYVFNIEQTDIDPAEFIPENPMIHPIEACENVLEGYIDKPTIKHFTGDPSYSVIQDLVRMPKLEHFYSAEGFYSTLFHELIHSTGHQKRLDRPTLTDIRAAFGSETYSLEELVAEIGSGFLNYHTGIFDKTVQNSSAYLSGWIQALKADHTIILKAASQAGKAYDYIIGKAS